MYLTDDGLLHSIFLLVDPLFFLSCRYVTDDGLHISFSTHVLVSSMCEAKRD